MINNRNEQMQHPVLLFDGECNFCRAIIHWIAKNDPKGIIRFAQLQSEKAKQLLAQHNIDPEFRESAVLFEEGRYYIHSDSVMQTFKYLQTPWRHTKMARVIPRVIRDWGYRRVSRNRSTISKAVGTIDCRWEPPPQYRHRFLDYD